MTRGARRKRYDRQIPVAWQPGPFQLLWLAARRVRRGGTPLVAVSLGMLIAVILLCAVPVYTTLAAGADLQVALTAQPPSSVNVEAQVIAPNSTLAAEQQVLGELDPIASDTIRPIAPTTSVFIQGPDLDISSINGKSPSAVDTTIAGNYLQPMAYDIASVQSRIRLLHGRLPAMPPSGGVLEALATPQSQLPVGAIVSTTPLGQVTTPVTVRIVGIFQPVNTNDPYWNDHTFQAFTFGGEAIAPPPVPFPVLVSLGGYFAALGRSAQSPQMIVHEIFYAQPLLITPDNMSRVANAINHFRSEVAFLGMAGVKFGTSTGFGALAAVTTQLPQIIGAVQQELTISDLPLFIVIVQVLALALLFVLAMASLLVESQAGEISVLKSRGASDAQTLAALTATGFLPALVVVVAGPLLATALSLLVIRLGIPGAGTLVASDLQGGFITRTATQLAVALPAVAGVLLGLGALAAPAWQSARLEVLAFRREQARPTHIPVWRRYYLDLALVGFCLVGYLELSQFGGLAVRSVLAVSGHGSPSLLLLVAPALLLLAGGLVLVRVVPPLLDLGFRRTTRARGVTGTLAFAQLTRGTTRFTRLTLLLALSVAMGLFALTYQSSLVQNNYDRAAYETGGDMRVLINPVIAVQTYYAQPIAHRMPTLPGVVAATGLERTTAQTPSAEGSATVSVYGIDPATFASVAYWRSDFADQPLATLLDGMRRHTGGSAAGQRDHPIWALISPGFAQFLSLQTGDQFQLVSSSEETAVTYFIVGAIVRDVPTIYDTDNGYIVVDGADLVTASTHNYTFELPVGGPSDWWLRTDGSPAHAAALSTALGDPNLFVQSVTSRNSLVATYDSDPVAAGITTLLLAGGLIAACLAVLGGLVQAAASARQRTVQFAILRTLGMSRRELTSMFLIEQLVMYAFGMAGGLVVGLALSVATLPYLEFAALLTDSAPPGVPPYQLVLNRPGTLLFLGAVMVAFALGLLWQRQVAVRVVLNRALRLGED